MANVIALSQAKLPDKNLVKRYLANILKNCGCDETSSFRVISIEHFTGITYDTQNPPPSNILEKLHARLIASREFGIVRYNEEIIHTVTGVGIVPSPIIKITHFNPDLLIEACKQESACAYSSEAGEASSETMDPSAWTDLPILIQSNWRKFNDSLRTYIMDCMMRYLQTHRSLNNLDYSPTLFGSTLHELPQIPVIFIHDDDSHEVLDLMDVLVSKPRINFSQLLPAEKPEELKFHLNTQSTPAPL